MKRKNKGFTLVELLAVIVILALIATPIILNVINDAKKQAAKDSFYENGKAVEKDDKKDDKKEEETIDVYKDGTAVYYNPVSGEKCDDYTEANSTKETKSGCMKWYAFNDKEGNATVNVILDHNTTARVAWNSTGTVLEADTKNWKNTARLITANEIAKITGHSTFDASKSGDWFYLDSNNQTQTANESNKSKYAWLFDYTIGCTYYGCNTPGSSSWGYWTSTPNKDNTGYAWHVSEHGYLYINYVGYTHDGIRPVITISKSNIS